MKTKSVIFILGVLLFITTPKTLASWEIYNDTDIPSGTYGLIDIYDSPPDNTTVNFYGDFADYIGTHDSSTLNIHNGEAELQAMDTSTINITGGILSCVYARGNSKVNFSNIAQIDLLVAENFGIINVSGGTSERIAAIDSGTIKIYGGLVTDYIDALENSIINIYGYDLTKTTSGGDYGHGRVYGYLSDDTYIHVNLYSPEAYDHIYFIPEPTTIALLLVGVLYIRNKRLTR